MPQNQHTMGSSNNTREAVEFNTKSSRWRMEEEVNVQEEVGMVEIPHKKHIQQINQNEKKENHKQGILLEDEHFFSSLFNRQFGLLKKQSKLLSSKIK